MNLGSSFTLIWQGGQFHDFLYAHDFDSIYLDLGVAMYIEELEVIIENLIDALLEHTFEDSVPSSLNVPLSLPLTHSYMLYWSIEKQSNTFTNPSTKSMFIYFYNG